MYVCVCVYTHAPPTQYIVSKIISCLYKYMQKRTALSTWIFTKDRVHLYEVV